MSRLPSRVVRASGRGPVPAPAGAGFPPAATALALAAAFSLQAAPAGAQPSGAQVIAGQASFARDGNNLVVTTRNAAGQNHSAINWQSFSVPAGSVTRFDQPSASSTSINRVVGNDPSAIFGTLSSNGRLVLVNPAGIAVGKGAVVDTAGFTASTLSMNEADAIAGRLLFSGGALGGLQVDGQVLARSGDIVLVAPQVQTGAEAVLESRNGATVLAAGRKVEITGRGLEGIRLEVQAPLDAAVNLGTLKGDAVGIFAGTLRHSGLVQAQAVSTEGGKVVLRALGDNLVDGTVTAQAGNRGGSVDVLGERVGLLAGASVDASGAAGGGAVRVGGDYQGGNAAVPNARATYVDAAASIRADATQAGDGGRVIVWSDEATRMHGRISARGGAGGGDGGFAEVSGKKYLAYTGSTDLRAPRGAVGTLLLDPEDVQIVDGAAGSTSPAQSGPDFNTDAGPATIADADLNEQLRFSNVQVTTGNSYGTGSGGVIHLQAGAEVAWGNSNTLSLSADQGIVLDGTIRDTLSSSAGSGSLHLFTRVGDISQGSGSVIHVANLYAEAGDGEGSGSGRVLLNTAGAANTVGMLAGAAYGSGSEFRFASTGDMTVGSVQTPYGGGDGIHSEGAVEVAAGGALRFSSVEVRGTTVTLRANGDIEFLEGGAQVRSSGWIDVQAGGALHGYNASFETEGGLDGWVSLVAAGDAEVGAVRTSGDSRDSGGERGGDVTITSSGGNITVDRIVADGGYGYSTSASSGGGGTIRLNAEATGSDAGAVTVNYSISARGGSAYQAGGEGGTVVITADKDINVYGRVDLGGGGSSGWSSGSLAAGGGGGSFTATSATGSIWVSDIAALGGAAYSLAGGGAGGAVTLAATAAGATVTADGDIDVRGGSGYQQGPGGDGGTITITGGGDVQLRYLHADGGFGAAASSERSGGAITLTSSQGAVRLGRPDDGDSYGYWGGATASGGDAYDGRSGDGGNIVVRANGADGAVYVSDVLLADAGAYGTAAGNGGNVTVTSSGPISLYNVYARGGSAGPASGGTGGRISIAAAGGDITASYLGVDGSGEGGHIDVLASQGSIWLDGASATGLAFGGSYGSDHGGAGGGILLRAQGTGTGAGHVRVYGGLDANGGYSAEDGRAGGDGGRVEVQAAQGMQIHRIDVSGGGVSLGSGAGGAGGTVVLTGTGGSSDPIVVEGQIRATGAAGGAGGAGGSVTVSTPGAIVLGPETGYYPTIMPYAAYAPSYPVDAGGGTGWDGAGGRGGQVTLLSSGGGMIHVQDYSGQAGIFAAGGAGAPGGQGGSVRVATSGSVIVPNIQAYGGSGYGPDGGAGAGGAGGSIDLQFGESLDNLAFVDAGGGNGQEFLGAGGAGGSISITSSGGGVRIGLQAFAGGGHGSTGGAGGSVVIETPGGIDIGSDLDNYESSIFPIDVAGGIGVEGAGGAGGSLTLRSTGGGNIVVQDLNGEYGITAGGGSGVSGGTGGQVTIATGASVSVPLVVAAGGSGYAGGSGGNGGRVTIDFGDLLSGAQVDARGGMGGNGEQGAASGGRGGDGGQVTLTGHGDEVVVTAASIDASGGAGGAALGGSAGTGGTGGAGGELSAAAPAGALTLAGAQLIAVAGNGGSHGDGSANPTAPGTGAVTLSADRGLSLAEFMPGAGLMQQSTVDNVVVGGKVLLRGDTVGIGASTTVVGQLATDIVANRLVLDGQLLTGTASIRALDATRAVHLAGSDAPDTLDISADELGRISANTLVIGDASHTGGLSVDGAITRSSRLFLLTGGTLTLGATVTSTAETATPVVLSGRQYQVASDATVVTPHGRWLAYVTGSTLEGNQFGGLVSGQHALWGRSMSDSPPDGVGDDGNRYLFAFRPTVTATAPSGQGKVYDGTTDLGGLQAALSGVPDPDQYGGAFLRDEVSVGLVLGDANAGTHALQQGETVLPASYNPVNFVSAQYTVRPRPLQVRADNQEKSQGQGYVFNGTEFTSDGLVAGQTLGSASLSSDGAPAGAGSGSYAIHIGNATGGNGFLAGNYDITYVPGTLLVKPVASQETPPPSNASVQQVSNEVTQFQHDFVTQLNALLQQEKKELGLGEGDIVVTDTACRI